PRLAIQQEPAVPDPDTAQADVGTHGVEPPPALRALTAVAALLAVAALPAVAQLHPGVQQRWRLGAPQQPALLQLMPGCGDGHHPAVLALLGAAGLVGEHLAVEGEHDAGIDRRLRSPG